jgi:hypothetical protein
MAMEAAAGGTTVLHANGTSISTSAASVTTVTQAPPITMTTWNIAAVNNNPFEYWITHDDDAYNLLMDNVQSFIDEPGERDVPVDTVFTAEMFGELASEMASVGMEGLDTVAAMWEKDYQKRNIISGFMKDKEIGNKRLASMPDRITNTINTLDEGAVCRPTIINCYDKPMDSVGEWWAQWKDFHFQRKVLVKEKKGKSEPKPVWSMLTGIKKEKYPAITEAEEAVSIPLQLLCGAIFDAILVHMLNTVSPGTWFPLKQSICESLVLRKTELQLGLLQTQYVGMDVIFLQEVAAMFVDKCEAQPAIASVFHMMTPEQMDGKRDQNSVLLLNKQRWDVAEAVEVTDAIVGQLDGSSKKSVAPGDLFALKCKEAISGDMYLLVSFHGDTNGQSSIPVLQAVHSIANSESLRLIVGIDANTYQPGSKKMLPVQEFAAFCDEAGMSICWGSTPEELAAAGCTTYNARTYLQPQLNKAVGRAEVAGSTHRHLKDYLLCYRSQGSFSNTLKDNTGNGPGHYEEDLVFPTLSFPSDHGTVSTQMTPV